MDIKEMVDESIETKKQIINLEKDIKAIADLLKNTLKNNKKILICGNGGSAADSQHVAAELVGRFKLERKGLSCIALTTDTSIITAWANDYDFDTIFERQVEALGQEGDILIGISTSGNSTNVIKAIDKAKQNNLKTIALLGKEGGKIKGTVDKELIISSNNTPRIQETHITILHIICELVEDALK